MAVAEAIKIVTRPTTPKLMLPCYKPINKRQKSKFITASEVKKNDDEFDSDSDGESF